MDFAVARKPAAPRAVERAADVLNYLAGGGVDASLADLSRRLGVPKASMSDLLNGLVASGFVRRNSDRFELGPAAFAFARKAFIGGSLADATFPFLEELARQLNETALTARFDELTMASVIVNKVEGEYPVRYSVPIGLRRELHSTSAGKLFLAYMSGEELDAYLGSVELRSFTPQTIVEPHKLREELRGIFSEGVSTTQDERTAGASGVAAPIFGPDAAVVGALVVAGVTPRIAAKREEIKARVRDTAGRISDEFRAAARTGTRPR